jgi:capsular polysaccharide biosynthesis protein
MRQLKCRECDLVWSPVALYISQGKVWLSGRSDDLQRFRQRCRHQEAWPNSQIVGCEMLRRETASWVEPARHASSPPPPQEILGEVSIVEVALASHLIEEKGEVPTLFQPVQGESHHCPEMMSDFQRNPGTTEIRGFELADVRLPASLAIMVQGGKRVRETRYLLEDEDYWQPLRGTRPVLTSGTVVIGYNASYGNYYHWMMQCLPAMEASVKNVGAANCSLALPPLAAWQEDSLTMLGFATLPRVRIDFDTEYHFDRAYYCTYLNGSAAFFLSPRCLSVLDGLAADIPAQQGAPVLLYVSRMDSGKRQMRNEKDVRQLLENLGFTTLVPGLFSLRDQIALFKAARIVVGAHGAGLTNLAFCQSGTAVLELSQSSYPNVCMNRIAQARGLRYHGECFDDMDRAKEYPGEWSVDIARLVHRVLDVLALPDLDHD